MTTPSELPFASREPVLEPCHKCGGRANLSKLNAAMCPYYVVCVSCPNDARMAPTQAQAVDLWNREQVAKRKD